MWDLSQTTQYKSGLEVGFVLPPLKKSIPARNVWKKILQLYSVLYSGIDFLTQYRFLFGYFPATDGYMKKGQKTQKKLEFRLQNQDNRQKAGLQSCFWALIGTNRDESAFWVVGWDVGFRSPNRDCPDEIGTVGTYGNRKEVSGRRFKTRSVGLVEAETFFLFGLSI